MSDQFIDYEALYNSLCKRVAEMIEVQKSYFKSNKDQNLLRKAKAIESQVYKEVTSSPDQIKNQQPSLPFEFLAK